MSSPYCAASGRNRSRCHHSCWCATPPPRRRSSTVAGTRRTDERESRSVVVGVDFGTLSGLALVVRVVDGAELASAVRPYARAVLEQGLPRTGAPLPPDWALQVPADWVEVLRTAVPQTLAACRVNPAQVVGIGTGLTACTVLPAIGDGTKCGCRRKPSLLPCAIASSSMPRLRNGQDPSAGRGPWVSLSHPARPSTRDESSRRASDAPKPRAVAWGVIPEGAVGIGRAPVGYWPRCPDCSPPKPPKSWKHRPARMSCSGSMGTVVYASGTVVYLPPRSPSASR